MEKRLMNLDGRIVVVSGRRGRRHRNEHAARMLAEAGATVVAVSRSREKIDKNLAPAARARLSIVPLVADVSTDEGVAATMEAARRTQRARCTGSPMSRAARRDRPGCAQPA